MNIEITKIKTEEALTAIFNIRQEVFVFEQNVHPEEEYDEFEETSTHFLALLEGVPAGTARWRYTDNGVKLERFAVLKEMRGKGVGQALVKAVVDDIAREEAAKGQLLYMHAQLAAVPLYEKFNFEKEGDIFSECEIEHYKMKRYL
ncbi:GNAT family N-acetyltransferase [Litoribacter alkaliphilus]|uniref:GNAT family N-acetyltransferase n=1 Tax=Litoribacter ruber TaxID=702568 RepID=A0AAP2G127_9BACT|nr:GNAT family N-acetyltransferase [Litoribacter alkaliphilus]MBS9523924.1 GNAT family N-acetyltransferase [Litoribacter alkaliphilus]